MKHLLLIVNPLAGQKKAAKRLSEIISVFNRAGYDVHTYITTKNGDVLSAVETLGANVDLIVCCGGDGTFNETITAVIQLGMDIPLGYIPAGSTNDFANSLTLKTNVVEAAKQIVTGQIHEYDVGKYGTRYFTYVASFGMFTKTSYTTPQSLKNSLGHMAYILSGINELSKIRTDYIRMKIDDEIIAGEYLFGAICNSTSVGGILTLKPELVDMCDGKFEILLVRSPKNLQELHECIISILNHTYNCQMITFRSASSVSITADPKMPWTLDGEQAPGNENITITNIGRRIKLIH